MRCWWVAGLCLALAGCSVLAPAPELASPDRQHALMSGKAVIGSYEQSGVRIDEAAAITADLTAQLVARFPPAQHQWVFRPPDAVLGNDLRDRLRSAGYGILAQPVGNKPELSYVFDTVNQRYYRVGLKLGQFRLNRLYGYQRGRLMAFGSATNGPKLKPANRSPVLKTGGQKSAGKTIQRNKPPQNRKAARRASVKQLSQLEERYALPAPKRQHRPEKRSSRLVKAVPAAVSPIKSERQPRLQKPHWFVQVMAGANVANLRYNQSLLKEAGYRVGIMPLQSKPVSALRVGGWTDKKQAMAALRQLESKYPGAFLWEALFMSKGRQVECGFFSSGYRCQANKQIALVDSICPGVSRITGHELGSLPARSAKSSGC